MTKMISLRLQKLAFALAHPTCWSALQERIVPAIEHRRILGALRCDRVIDVGANRGQFSLVCRLAMPGVPITAFEPLPSEAVVYQRIHGCVPGVELQPVALGEHNGEVVLHLSRQPDCSSLLPIGAEQVRLFPHTDEVGTLDVTVRCLDDYSARWALHTHMLLKLDVQGFELPALRGAIGTLIRCSYVYAECSEVPLYEGQALFPEVSDFLITQGFRLIKRVNPHRAAGQLIQADYLFGRV